MRVETRHMRRDNAPGITLDREIMGGQPTIRGTRLTAEHVLQELASGATYEELLDEYPRLTIEGIRAAMAYAAGQIHRDMERLAPAAAP